MGGTRDPNPNLAAAARERAPRSVGEGNKRLSVRLQSRWNTTRRDLCRDNRDLHKNRREATVPRRQRTLRPLMMRMATRKDSSSVHAPLSRYVRRCRVARTSGVCACGVWRRRRAGGMRRIACCIT